MVRKQSSDEDAMRPLLPIEVEIAKADVSILEISQATTATFTDLYIQYTLLVFIQVGSKRVFCPLNGELIGQTEDVLIFPQGSMVTMENRPLLGQDYRAMGVFFPHSG